MHPVPDRPRFQLPEAPEEEPYLDPSLDPCALTPLEPKADPRLTWSATGLLVAGAATALLTVKVAPLVLADESRRTVAVSLTSEVPTFDPQVVPLLEPQRVPSGGRAGGGDDAIDPRMVSRLDATLRPQITVPDTPLQAMPAGPSGLVFGAKDLPQMPGGSGLQRGTGEGTGGDGRGGPDPRLVVTYQYRPMYQLPPDGALLRAEVVVAIVVDAAGRVTSARCIQGPEILRANAEESALKWRFEPLAKHGLTAPQRVNITFHYRRTDLAN